MSADLRRRRLRPWAEAARLVLGAQEALPIATIFERIKERGLRDTTPGSKECLFSMMRAHSRGQHSLFYRRLQLPPGGQGAPTICFGLRSDLPPSTSIVETDADTDDESQKHDSRFKPKVQLLKLHQQHTTNGNSDNGTGDSEPPASANTPNTTESEAENVAPDDIVTQQQQQQQQQQQTQLKRKAPGAEDPILPPKRCLRPKPQRNSDEKAVVTGNEDFASASTPERNISPFTGSTGSGSIADDLLPPPALPATPTESIAAVPEVTPMVTEPSIAPQSNTLTTHMTTTRSATAGLSSRGGGRWVPPASGTGFQTMREMLNNISDQCGIRLNRRPGKKMTLSQQLEESKRGLVDLESPDSILVNVNVKELLSTFAFSLLPRNQQRQLLAMLPPVELLRRGGQGSTLSEVDPSGASPNDADLEVNMDSALNNEFFASACQEWRERLMDGDLTAESQLKQKAEYEKHLRSVDSWKRRNFEVVWGVSAASRAENALEERVHLLRIRREHEQNIAEQEKLRLAVEAKQSAERLAAERAAASALEMSIKECTVKVDPTEFRTSAPAGINPVVKVERLIVTEPPPPPPPPLSTNASMTNAATPSTAAPVKIENETEEELLAKEEARIATLLPYCSETLHEVLAEHGVPVSANHRRKCNNLVPASLCLAARRVGLRLLPPPKCLIPSPVAIPRRRLAFHKAAAHRPILDELIASETAARFERDSRQLAEHLQRVDWLVCNPPPITLPVPLSVHELMADLLTLVESDRVGYYPLLPGISDCGTPFGVPSGGSHSYATSTVGTPSHAGTNVDENFGSELMFSVATDEEPPTDMSDDAIGSELSESRPTTAVDHLLDTSGAMADIDQMDHLGMSLRTAGGDPDVAMLSEDDTRDAMTPELPTKPDSFTSLTAAQETQEELCPETVPLEDTQQEGGAEPVSEARHDSGDEYMKGISAEKSASEKTRKDDRPDEAAAVQPSQSEEDEDEEDGSPDCVILDEENFSDQAASPEIVTAEHSESLLPENRPEDSEQTREDLAADKKAVGFCYPKQEGEEEQATERLSCSKNEEDKGAEGGDEADEMEESLEIETSAEVRSFRDTGPWAMADRLRSASPEDKRGSKTESGNLLRLPEKGEPSGESEQQCAPKHEMKSTGNSPSESGNADLDAASSSAMVSASAEKWLAAQNVENIIEETGSHGGILYVGCEKTDEGRRQEEEERFGGSPDARSPPTSDATLSDEDTDIDTLLPGGGRGTIEDDLRNCETASDSTIEEEDHVDHRLHDHDSDHPHGQRQSQRILHNQSSHQSDDCSNTPATTREDSTGNGRRCRQTSRTRSTAICSPPPGRALREDRLAQAHDEPDTSARPASFVSGGGLAPPPLPPRCRAQAAGGFSNRRRRRALSCRDLLMAVEQRKKAGQAANGSPCCLQDAQAAGHTNGGDTGGPLGDGSGSGCLCKLQPMLPCQKCGAFWHSDCIGPSRICSTCLLV